MLSAACFGSAATIFAQALAPIIFAIPGNDRSWASGLLVARCGLLAAAPAPVRTAGWSSLALRDYDCTPYP
jgi:hypothetical protein